MNLSGYLPASWCWALHGPHLQHLLPGLQDVSGWTPLSITCRCVHSSPGRLCECLDLNEREFPIDEVFTSQEGVVVS